MAKIFSLIEKEPNQSLTIEEFVESYIYYEEQLKIKIKKIEKYLDDLINSKKAFEEQKEQAEKIEQENEQEKGKGLTNKSSLYITIIEAKDLDSDGIIGECNPFTQITFQGKVFTTSTKKNDYNPVWGENFKYKITSLGDDEKIKFEVLTKTFFGEKSLGSITINLNNLIDQDELDNLFDLNPGKGKIRMKLKCILNLVNYYNKEIKKKEEDLQYFNQLYGIMQVYEEEMKNPFGLIYCQDLEILLDKENLKQSEQIIDYNFAKNMQNILSSVEKEQDRNTNTKKITWNRTTKILIIIFVASIFFTLLERSNFLDLFLGISLTILFIIDKSNDIDKYLQPLILTFGFSLLYDFIWFISQFGVYISDSENPEIKLKRFIYFICIGNSLIKICLIQGLNNVKRKKLNSSLGPRAENI
jgi:hypothetical protein